MQSNYYNYYENLSIHSAIGQAFSIICFKKMLVDGYIDMSLYISGRIKKEEMKAQLRAQNSDYSILYTKTYPNKQTALSIWNEEVQLERQNEVETITQLEATAIVNWVYRTLVNAEERVEFTLDVFRRVKELYAINHDIRHANGVFFNNAKVTIHFLSSIVSLNKFITSIKRTNQQLFFRGHTNANYMLLPSVMRTQKLKSNESKMYQELLINCPEDFSNCHTHLEKLVEMQHYGLPTRLLDITRNLLVALYFACEDEDDNNYGEIIIISADWKDIKYPQSDTVSILASLPVFSEAKQQELARWAMDPKINKKGFNEYAKRLLHEIRLEKPAFQPEINKDDIINSFIVYALKNNNRIVKQDGAFILCGLLNDNNSLERFRFKEKGKKVILLINKKKKIMKELENYSITQASLFPEIDNVAAYIKSKYC